MLALYLREMQAVGLHRTDTTDTAPKPHARKLMHKHDVSLTLPGIRVKNQGGTVLIAPLELQGCFFI